MNHLKRFILCPILVLQISAFASTTSCPSFYAEAHRMRSENISLVQEDMQAFAGQFLKSLAVTDGLTLQAHGHVIATLKAMSNVTSDINQFDQAFSIITLENQAFKHSAQLSSNFVESIEALDTNIKTLIGEQKKSKSKLTSDPQHALAVMDNYNSVKWILNEFKMKGQVEPEMNKKLAEEFNRIREFESRLEAYYNRVTFFTHSLGVLGANFTESPQKLNSLMSLFYESTKTAHRDLEQVRSLKSLIDQQATNSGLAAMALQNESRLDLSYYLMKNGMAPQAANDLAGEIASHVSNRASIEQKIKAKKQARANFFANIKNHARSAVVALSTVGALGGAYLGHDYLDTQKQAKVVSLQQAVTLTVGTVSPSNQLLMEKYQNNLPSHIRDYASAMKSPKAVWAALRESKEPLDPGAIIYLVNYAPVLYELFRQNWGGFETVLSAILEKKVVRGYTEQEKTDLISSVTTFRDKWEVLEKKQFDLNVSREEKIVGSFAGEAANRIDPLLKGHLESYSVEQAAIAEKKKAAEAKLKKETDERVQAELLLTKSRHLLLTQKEVEAVSIQKANPLLKAIFETNDQESIVSQLRVYAEKNEVSNSDLVFILMKTANFESLVKSVQTNYVQDFENRMEKFSGISNGNYSYDISQTALAIDYVLRSAKLESMGAQEAIFVKKLLDSHRMFTRDYSRFRIKAAMYKNYLSSQLNDKIQVKTK